MLRPPSRPLAFLAAVIVVSLLALAAPLRAEPPSPADLTLARQFFDLGRTYYDQGDYEKALDAFEQSYRLSRKPALLHNIAKCQESLGRLEAAVASYERFLRESGQRDATIDARIRNLKVRLETQRASAAAAAVAAAPPPKVAPRLPPPSVGPPATSARARSSEPPRAPAAPVASAPAPAPVTAQPAPQLATPREPAPAVAFDPTRPGQRSRLSTWVGWSLIGVGGAALVTSIVLGARAKAKAELTEKAYRCGADPASSGDCPATPYAWTQIENTIDRDGRALEGAQVATLLVGLIAAGSGAAVLAFAPRDTPVERRVQLAPALGPGSVALTGQVAF